MTNHETPTIQPIVRPSAASIEKERTRDSLFTKNRSMKGKPKGQTDEEWAKARKQAQDEYMDKLEKQFIR